METILPAEHASTHHGLAAHFAERTGTFGLGARPDVLVELRAEANRQTCFYEIIFYF